MREFGIPRMAAKKPKEAMGDSELEREAGDLVVMAQKAVISLFGLAVALAPIVEDGPRTADEQAAIKGAKLAAKAVSEFVGAIRLAILGDAGASKADDRELWAIYDRALKHDFHLVALAVDSLDHVWYSQVGGPADPESATVAAKTAEWCAADLDLDRVPRIHWFAERARVGDPETFRSSPGTTGGLKSGTVWAHAGLSPRDAIRTVAHECKHLAQGGNDLDEIGLDYSDRPSERDAHGYGKGVALRLWGKYGHGPASIWLRNARVEAYSRAGNF